MLNRKFVPALCVLILAAAPLASAADSIDVPLPAATWTKTYGNLQVQKYGTGDPALVLVPGLACGAWTWNGTIASEAKTHAVYAVTVGGFDGVAPAQPQTLAGIESSLVALIAGEKIDHPILIGHSLGGTTVLKFGVDHSDLVRAIVSVDGTPVFPSLADQTPDERKVAASTLASNFASMSASDFVANETHIVTDYVTDPAVAAHVAQLAAKSNQGSVAAYTQDLMSSDLRPDLAKLTAPTLLIGPVPALPLPSYYPPAMASLAPDARVKSTAAYYQFLLKAAPHVQIVTIPNSRHFVMLDQPAAFATALDTFIGSVK